MAYEFEPVIIEKVSLSLGGTDFAGEMDSVTLVPTTAKTKFKPVNGKKKTRMAMPDWALTLNVGQSFDKASLTAKLIEGHGTEVPFVLTPQGAGSVAKIEGVVTLEAMQVGGASEAVAVSGVTLDVSGQPKFTWAGDATAAAASTPAK